MCKKIFMYLAILLPLMLTSPLSAQSGARITVLYDAFGKASSLTKDWGFAALVEYNGMQVLFDTGNNAGIFAHNINSAGIDLKQLDFAIISHRHGDHMGGLTHLLEVAPEISIYAPKEGFGVFGATKPGNFYPANEALPPEMRYFDGKPPETLTFGTAWPNGKFSWIGETTEIKPGFHLIALVGNWGTDLAVRELSLAIDTPKGIVLVVGCSHPTIEKIVETAKATLNKPVHLVIGGTHLLHASRAEIHQIVSTLHEELAVEWIAPAHCTGEPAFEILQQTFTDHYLYAGLGTAIAIDPESNKPLAQTIVPAAAAQHDSLIYRLLSATETFHSEQLASQH